ncbi:hypothetical protein BGZ76_007357 [Entomortierella beljakovae]|nr:hypothetical protein BGZ76_007357 [Entomortierella beljakovae]
MKFGSNSGGYNNGSSKKYGGRGNAKSAHLRNQREKKWASQSTPLSENASLSDIPTLRGIYDSIVQARDQPLDRTVAWNNSRGDDMMRRDTLSLGSLYQDYSGPMLRSFVEGWLKNISSPGGYGNVIGKRNAGTIEIPTLQQWIAGSLGVCECLGINTLVPPEINNNKHLEPNSFIGGDNAASIQEDIQTSTEDHAINNKLSKMSIGGNGTGGGGGGGNGRRSGNGKKYSHRCANLVQKKIQDYIQTDDVMEELYGQKPDALSTNTSTRAHSERYLKLKPKEEFF